MRDETAAAFSVAWWGGGGPCVCVCGVKALIDGRGEGCGVKSEKLGGAHGG